MTDRLTSKWTSTAAEAFGASGAKGDRGEQFMCEVYSSWGWEFEHFPSSFAHQVGGVDFSFRKPEWANFYTADIKSNLDQYGNFYVETNDDGWLFNPQKVSDRIWHVNPDTGWMAWYDRKEMRRYILSEGLWNTTLCKFTVRDKLDFIKRRRHNVQVQKQQDQFDDVPY